MTGKNMHRQHDHRFVRKQHHQNSSSKNEHHHLPNCPAGRNGGVKHHRSHQGVGGGLVSRVSSHSNIAYDEESDIATDANIQNCHLTVHDLYSSREGQRERCHEHGGGSRSSRNQRRCKTPTLFSTQNTHAVADQKIRESETTMCSQCSSCGGKKRGKSYHHTRQVKYDEPPLLKSNEAFICDNSDGHDDDNTNIGINADKLDNSGGLLHKSSNSTFFNPQESPAPAHHFSSSPLHSATSVSTNSYSDFKFHSTRLGEKHRIAAIHAGSTPKLAIILIATLVVIFSTAGITSYVYFTDLPFNFNKSGSEDSYRQNTSRLNNDELQSFPPVVTKLITLKNTTEEVFLSSDNRNLNDVEGVLDKTVNIDTHGEDGNVLAVERFGNQKNTSVKSTPLDHLNMSQFITDNIDGKYQAIIRSLNAGKKSNSHRHFIPTQRVRTRNATTVPQKIPNEVEEETLNQIARRAQWVPPVTRKVRVDYKKRQNLFRTSQNYPTSDVTGSHGGDIFLPVDDSSRLTSHIDEKESQDNSNRSLLTKRVLKVSFSEGGSDNDALSDVGAGKVSTTRNNLNRMRNMGSQMRWVRLILNKVHNFVTLTDVEQDALNILTRDIPLSSKSRKLSVIKILVGVQDEMRKGDGTSVFKNLYRRFHSAYYSKAIPNRPSSVNRDDEDDNKVSFDVETLDKIDRKSMSSLLFFSFGVFLFQHLQTQRLRIQTTPLSENDDGKRQTTIQLITPMNEQYRSSNPIVTVTHPTSPASFNSTQPNDERHNLTKKYTELLERASNVFETLLSSSKGQRKFSTEDSGYMAGICQMQTMCSRLATFSDVLLLFNSSPLSMNSNVNSAVRWNSMIHFINEFVTEIYDNVKEMEKADDEIGGSRFQVGHNSDGKIIARKTFSRTTRRTRDVLHNTNSLCSFVRGKCSSSSGRGEGVVMRKKQF